MKLNEISTTQLQEAYISRVQLRNDIRTYCHQWKRTKTFEQSVHYIIRRMQSWTMYGSMYRALAFSPRVFFQTHDYRILLSRLQSYALRRNNPTQIFSWSQTIDGMITALGTNANSPNNPTKMGASIVIEQTGPGVDVSAVLATPIELMHGMFSDEQEVLAPMNNSINLVGFYFNGAFYEYEEYEQFIADVRQKLKSKPQLPFILP